MPSFIFGDVIDLLSFPKKGREGFCIMNPQKLPPLAGEEGGEGGNKIGSFLPHPALPHRETVSQ